MPAQSTKTVFVIMPFADKYKSGYEEIIEPAISAAGLNCVRADQEALGHIHQMMFERIFESPVVVADISGGNPNVFYELGVSHTAACKTVTIAREDFAESIPFDIAHYRLIVYPKKPENDATDQIIQQYEKNRENAISALSTVLSEVIDHNSGGVSNPVQAYLSTRSPVTCGESRYFDSLPDTEEEEMIRYADSQLIAVGITSLHFLKILAQVMQAGERTEPLHVQVLGLDPKDRDGWRYVYHLREGRIVNDQEFEDFLADDQIMVNRARNIINRLNRIPNFKGEFLFYSGIPVHWAYVVDQSRILVGNYAMNRLFAKLPVSVLVDDDPRTRSMYRYYNAVVQGLLENTVPDNLENS